MTAAQRIADKYIGRDGSNVGTHPARRELTRAAVFAAQKQLCEILSVSKSPICDRDMHSILLAATKASPELFGN